MKRAFILLATYFIIAGARVPENCFSAEKLFPKSQTMWQGSIKSDLNLLLGKRFEDDMKLASLAYCEQDGETQPILKYFQIKLQGENQLFLNGFGKADSVKDTCNILQLQSTSDHEQELLSIASITVSFDSVLKGMTFGLSDGSSFTIGNSVSEMTN